MKDKWNRCVTSFVLWLLALINVAGASASAPLSMLSDPLGSAPLEVGQSVASAKPRVGAVIKADATVGTAMDLSLLSAVNGTPYQWSHVTGSLPPGLAMNSAGLVTGTPTEAGKWDLVVQGGAGTSIHSSKTVLPVEFRVRRPALVITSSTLSSGQTGTAYTANLEATGGTPSYTWSLTAGALPAGLSLSKAGLISGTPASAGSFSFSVSVTDSGNPAQVKTLATAITIAQAVSPYTTWYVRPDGGTRYSANVAQGQCDGKSDTAYPGTGVNQHCAFKDFRYLWDDKSGRVGSGAWVISGGDTVLVRGCTADATQSNASNPSCRLGWDAPTGTGANLWCYGVGSYTCYNPPIPAGTAQQHTRILGQNYANCNVGDGTNPRDYASNLTQLFAGFSLSTALNLQSTRYVDVQCIELTTHNGQCVTSGSPQYPRPCNRNQPLDDYALNGLVLNNASSNINFQDIYVHGFNSSGFDGPIGGAITMTRVFAGFNAFAGWNFDDGSDTPDAAGSQILAHYVTMIGNGCYEEYPVKHAFSGQACYDDISNGFGDAWSGQDTDLDTLTCDHCVMAYNVKDGFIGPHTNVKTLTITNSQSYGNMGAQWKWNNTPGAITTFTNNLTIGGCARFAEPIPGAAQSFALSSGLNGAYLSDYCRAGGNTVAINSQQNSQVLFANNTFIDNSATVFLLSCGPQGQNQNGMCGSTKWQFTNNIFLGYSMQGYQAPGLFYINDPSITVTQTNNLQYGNRPGHGEVCGTNGNLCIDPGFVNEPPQQAWTTQSFLDNFNFHLGTSSSARYAGATYPELPQTDIYGTTRQTPPTMGAVE